MSRPAKGPRLWPQPERKDASGTIVEHAVWVVRDGKVKRSTGVRVTDDRRPSPEAEQGLQAYLAGKHTAPREGYRPLAAIPIADVINIYVADKAAMQARPKELAGRAKALLAFWGDRTLDKVKGDACIEFIRRGGTRRQLEDLSAAIGHHLERGLHRELVKVLLPPRGVPRQQWLLRSDVARLIWAAWRYREVQKGKETGRRSRRHVARFILIGVYTGTRAGAICAASFQPTEGRGWINLETGVFYRRPEGERETNKRKAPVRLPDRLLAHLRRWKRKGICRHHPVEWLGRPVRDVDKAFRNAVRDAGLPADVTPHVLKHTAITWAMQNGMSKEEAASFFSTTVDVIERVYWHHSPFYQEEAAGKMGKRPGRREPSNVIRIGGRG